MNTLITICARAGSKRLPNKAIKPFYGKPLIQWSLEQAWQYSKNKSNVHIALLIEKKYEKIVSDLKLQGVFNTFIRPKRLGKDDTPKLDVIRYGLKKMEKFWDIEFNIIIDLDVCNPARHIKDIEDAVGLYKTGRFDNVVSVVPARRNPYYNQIQYCFGAFLPAGHKINNMDEEVKTKVPDNVYDMNNSLLLMGRDWLMKKFDHPVCLGTGLLIVEDWKFVDIDTELDFQLAEYLFVRNMGWKKNKEK